MQADKYFDLLYPFQDDVIKAVSSLQTKFYLTGGTALSRGYLGHRFSDDLDFFVNDDENFSLYVDRVIAFFNKDTGLMVDVSTRFDRYTRLVLKRSDSELLKVEFINDVPSHIGDIVDHQVLGRLDSPENILANKVTAVLAREEPKDLADIWGLCFKRGLSLNQALSDANSKAAGVFPADLARVLMSASQSDWEVIKWIEPPEVEVFIAALHGLGEELVIIK
jgi:hypothetical protein